MIYRIQVANISYLGFRIWRIVPRIANATNKAAEATYAHPRKGFLPPIQDTVEITIDFVPLYDLTGKSKAEIKHNIHHQERMGATNSSPQQFGNDL
jgi:hypothetical protein